MSYPSYWSEFPHLLENVDVHASTMRASDGQKLYLLEMGASDAIPVVLVNPPAGPFLLVSKMAAGLSHRFRIVSWETRGGPYLDDEANALDVTPSRTARDLVEIVEGLALGRCHYVVVCAGLTILLDAMEQLSVPPASISVVAPPGDVSDGPAQQSRFQTVFMPKIMELADGKVEDEASLCSAIQLIVRTRPADPSIDGTIMALCSLNLRSLDAMKKYARIAKNFAAPRDAARQPYPELLAETAKSVPVALLHCKDDDVVDYRRSVDACSSTKGIKLVLYPSGSHFMFFKHADAVAADIMAFIGATASMP